MTEIKQFSQSFTHNMNDLSSGNILSNFSHKVTFLLLLIVCKIFEPITVYGSIKHLQTIKNCFTFQHLFFLFIKHLIFWFFDNTQSLLLISFAVVLLPSTHPTTTWSSRSFINLRPFILCQFKPMRMLITTTIFTNNAKLR